MKDNEKKSVIALLSGLGTVVLLLGLFTPLYEFMYGLVAAIAIWILTSVASTYLGVRDTKTHKEHKSPKQKKKDFKSHLIVYIVIIAMLLVINLLTFDNEYWFHWPALVWGAFVAIQGFLTYFN